MKLEKSKQIDFFRNNSWYLFLALIPLLIYSPYTIEPVLHIRYISLALFELLGLCLLMRNINIHLTLPLWGMFFFIAWSMYLLFSLTGLFIYGDKSGDGTFLWLQILLVGGLPFILSQIFLSTDSFADNVIKLFVIAGALALIIGIFNFTGIKISKQLSHADIYGIKSVFAHKNIFSEILLLILSFSIIAIINLKGFWKHLGSIEAINCVLMIIVLMSKAVWLAFIIGSVLTLIVLLVLSILSPLKIKYHFTRKYKANLIFYLIVAITGLFSISGSGLVKPITNQLRDLATVHVPANQDRLEVWKKTIELTRNHKLSGIGLGNWKIDILKEGNENMVSQDNLTFFTRPHNDYLWIFSEQGLPALIFYVFALVIIIMMCYRMALHSVKIHSRLYYLLLNFTIISYMVFSCFSFPKERIEHSIILGFLFAIILIDYNRKFEKNSLNFSKIILFPLSFFILISIFVGVSRYISELHLKHAYEARIVQDWQQEESEIDHSYSRFFKMDFMNTPLMWYKGEACFNLNNIDEALHNFKEAELVNPYHMHVLNNIGTCYELKGNHTLAIRYFEAANCYSVYFEDAIFNLTAVYFNLNDYEMAVQVLQRINPDTEDKRYAGFVYAVLNKYMKQLIINNKDEIINRYLTKISYDRNWSYQIFIKSAKSSKDFKKQLMLDIFWSVDIIDKDFASAKKIRGKKII